MACDTWLQILNYFTKLFNLLNTPVSSPSCAGAVIKNFQAVFKVHLCFRGSPFQNKESLLTKGAYGQLDTAYSIFFHFVLSILDGKFKIKLLQQGLLK